MNCDEARELIDRGMTPGTRTPRRAALGFHLAGCAACRARYAARDEQLLTGLLGATPRALAIPEILAASLPPAVEDLPVIEAVPPQDQSPVALPMRTSSVVRSVALALLFVVLSGIGYIGYTLYTIRSNVAAMQLPTPRPTTNALRPSREPTLVVPSVIARAATPAARRTAIAVAASPVVATTPPEPTARRVLPSPTPGPVTATPQLLPVPAIAGLSPAAPLAAPVSVPVPASGQAINVLLVGIDRRPNEAGGSRSDAIMIAHLDPDRKRVALLSLPRDLVVNIPGYGYGRINAASMYGDLYPELGGGVALTRETVSTLLDLPIHYVVRVDFNGFTGVVDALGGVDITVEKELYDPAYPTMDYGYMIAHFLPGTQHMDGATALIYARVRHMDSDFERMRRQQQVVMAAAQQLKQQNTLQQLQSVAAMTTALRHYIETDLPQDKMAGLVWAFRNVAPNSVERYALDGNYVQMGLTADDPYAEYPLPGAVEELVGLLTNGPVKP